MSREKLGNRDVYANTQYRARLRYARVGPNKVRGIADLIRGVPVLQAEVTLHRMPNRGAAMLLKLLRSAVANAKQQNPALNEAELMVSFVTVDQGPPFMRKWMPRAHGRATPIKRLTSHLSLAVDVI
jgi:large subunit ribosomal protein L22